MGGGLDEKRLSIYLEGGKGGGDEMKKGLVFIRKEGGGELFY